MTARALVSTENGEVPSAGDQLDAVPIVQHYRVESFGEISPAENVGRGLKIETTENNVGSVFLITVGETTAPLSWAAPSDPRARLGRIEFSGVPVDNGQVVGSLSSGTPEESGSRDLRAHLIERRFGTSRWHTYRQVRPGV